ncbi:MAG: LytTR family DNA-binding domain-containing protein [Pseudomonadota bacterium]
MMIRTLIVDDEPLAREGLLLLLENEPDIDVIQQCGNGSEAIQAILKLQPDLILLDIQMPRIDGFDVIEAVGPAHMPFVIFVTAHNEYAVEAFNIHAIDYLLKPVRKSRLQESLGRVKEKILHKKLRQSGEKLGELLTLFTGENAAAPVDKSNSAREDDRIIVRSHGHVYFLQTRNILWVEAEGDYVTIHTPQKSHLLRDTMRNMEQRLDSHGFKRIHRSAIINLSCVSELKLGKNNDYNVVLTDGTVLSLGRSYKDALYASLGGVALD